MSGTKRSASILVATVLMTAAFPGAQGQNASPSGAQSANQSAATAAPQPGTASTATGSPAGLPAAGTPSSAASPAPGAAPADGASASVPPGSATAKDSSTSAKRVCFKLSGRCVEPSKTKAKAADGKPLNLTAPDVQKVFPADELKEPLPTNEQITEVQEDQTVAVKGEKVGPEVPLGFGALWWALNHPSQAWRIVLPEE